MSSLKERVYVFYNNFIAAFNRKRNYNKEKTLDNSSPIIKEHKLTQKSCAPVGPGKKSNPSDVNIEKAYASMLNSGDRNLINFVKALTTMQSFAIKTHHSFKRLKYGHISNKSSTHRLRGTIEGYTTNSSRAVS